MPWGAFTISAGQLVAAASLAVLGAINYVGVRSGNMVNVVHDDGEGRGPGGAADHGARRRRGRSPSYTPIVPPISPGRSRRSASR